MIGHFRRSCDPFQFASVPLLPAKRMERGLAGILFGLKQRANFHSKSYSILQKNLQKINLRWNELNLSLDKLDTSIAAKAADELQAEEYDKARISSVLFLSWACVLSWLGLFFLIMIWISLHFLGKSRLRTKLFASQLSHGELDASAVINIYKELALD